MLRQSSLALLAAELRVNPSPQPKLLLQGLILQQGL